MVTYTPEVLNYEYVRLMLDPQSEGCRNMAVDEALLLSVDEGSSGPVVRLYGFAPATLSVGRFQETENRIHFEDVERDGVTFVRRPTGGQAVLHSDELTYAVVMGREHLANFSKRRMYLYVAGLLATCLEALGVPHAEVVRRVRGDPMDPDCFSSTNEYEIDGTQHRKLVGSAQMVTRNAVLQHGSVPLSDANRAIVRYLCDTEGSGHRPTSLKAETGRTVSFTNAREVFADNLSKLLPLKRDELHAKELEHVEELYRTKYSRDEWNRKY